MSVTRGALLISNPGEPDDEHYCKGVRVDIENYKRLFKDSHGGFWFDREIITLDRPYAYQVKAAVQVLSNYEYAFIAFSGHGYFSNIEKDTILCLRKQEEIPLESLLSESNKRSIVIDCCREVHNEPSAARILNFAAAESTTRRPNPAECRELFEEKISACSRGIVTIHSCSKGETAGDDETTGGRYTCSLISAANTWAESKGRELCGKAAMSIVRAHMLGEQVTKAKSGNTQNPTIEKPRTEREYFPFAVFA